MDDTSETIHILSQHSVFWYKYKKWALFIIFSFNSRFSDHIILLYNNNKKSYQDKYLCEHDKQNMYITKNPIIFSTSHSVITHCLNNGLKKMETKHHQYWSHIQRFNIKTTFTLGRLIILWHSSVIWVVYTIMLPLPFAYDTPHHSIFMNRIKLMFFLL